MPAVVGAVNVNSVDGVFNIGDVVTIAPIGYFRTFAGGGSFNSGDTLNISNSPSVINIYGTDGYEQKIVASNPLDGQVKSTAPDKSADTEKSDAADHSTGSDQEDKQP